MYNGYFSLIAANTCECLLWFSFFNKPDKFRHRAGHMICICIEYIKYCGMLQLQVQSGKFIQQFHQRHCPDISKYIVSVTINCTSPFINYSFLNILVISSAEYFRIPISLSLQVCKWSSCVARVWRSRCMCGVESIWQLGIHIHSHAEIEIKVGVKIIKRP